MHISLVYTKLVLYMHAAALIDAFYGLGITV